MFVHLRKFVDEQYGSSAWDEILAAARLGPRVYLPITAYPDEELAAIIGAAAEKSGQPVPRLLESFGEHVAPQLLSMYRHLLDPSWKTLDVLEHVENTAHRAVRVEQRGATPPYLAATRVSDRQLEINYTSARRLCHVAKGIIRGLSRHFEEEATISEPACMHRGADRCLLVVSVRNPVHTCRISDTPLAGAVPLSR
jgi:predicted hydrocarbon binding protein